MNHIRRLIGNDLLTPYRTLGGKVGIERRLGRMYRLCEYDESNSIDYSKYF